VLHALDASAGASAGWERICAGDDAAPPPGAVIETSLCRGIDVGDYRLVQAAQLIFVRRHSGDTGYGPPAFAHDPGGDYLDPRGVDGVELREGKLHVRGWRFGRTAVEPWTVIIDPAVVFRDRDVDGVTDATEVLLGTDPARADTDGDGIADGRDVAPLAKARQRGADMGNVESEVVRYLSLFLAGGPILLRADTAAGGDGAPTSGVVLHRARSGPPASDDRMCGSRVELQSVRLIGDEARVDVRWASGRDWRGRHALTLRRLGGEFRTVADESRPMPIGFDAATD
jgi:hypothetical protein